MHSNLRRVADAGRDAGLELEVRRFPEGTRTAADAARAIGCEVAQIVKSLVFIADDRPVLALVSGADRVDTERLARALGASATRRATGDEARSATGFAIGGVPPFGHAEALIVLVDPRLLAHEVVWAAAGLPDAVFAIRPEELVRVSGARVADLAESAAA
jgi:prolyl-tRNA editing enzyme YbaK/EbsC (Cys-tRNA(Pro) deacylase)